MTDPENNVTNDDAAWTAVRFFFSTEGDQLTEQLIADGQPILEASKHGANGPGKSAKHAR